MVTKEQAEYMKKFEEELKTKYDKETEALKEEVEKLKNQTFKVPISCPECDHKFKAGIKPKEKEQK